MPNEKRRQRHKNNILGKECLSKFKAKKQYVKIAH